MAGTKKTVYVGGLADEVDINILKSAFSAFGDIVDVSLPIDYSSQKHKGFAFIEYQLPEDAADAIDNMDNGEILEKTIRVNLAKPNRFRENTNKPVWADDEYFRRAEADSGEVSKVDSQDPDKKETEDNDSVGDSALGEP